MDVLRNETYLGCDTETEDLSAHSNRMWSIQISDAKGKYGVLIPVNCFLDNDGRMDAELVSILAPFFRDHNKTFVFHNAKFDVQWLRAQGIEMGNVFCTAIAEKLLTAGKLGVGNDLKNTLKRRFNIELTKEDRKDFYDGTFLKDHLVDPLSAWTNKLIDYAMGDVYPLVKLMKQQLADVKHWGLQDTLALENDVLYVTAKMEYIGIGIDAEGCRQFQIDMAKRRDESLAEILAELQPVWEKLWRKQYAKDMAKWDAWSAKKKLLVAANNKRVNGKLTESAIKERAEWDAKKPFKSKPKEKGELKLRSATPMKQTLYAWCGLALDKTDKETLEQNRNEHPILEKILEYKKYAKLAEFGELYEKIDPFTGRIHASYNQIVSTGRFSCSAPNLQQIPSRTDEGTRLRALFQSRKGYKFVGADFAGIELVILFVLGKDKVGLDAINSGKDIHAYTMSHILKCPYPILEKLKNKIELSAEEEVVILEARKAFEKVFDLPLVSEKGWDSKGLKEWFKALRDATKTLSYGLAYSMSKYGLARKFHCEVEYAEKFTESFFNIYKGVGEHVKKSGQLGYERGYAETKIGRKRFFRQPKKKSEDTIIREMVKGMEKAGVNWKALPEQDWEYEVSEALKLHKKEIQAQISAIKREAGNMPIQGMSADITKLAMVLLEDELYEHGFAKDEGLILVVHDELICECKDEYAQVMSELLEKTMTEAAHHFLGEDVLIVVEPYIDTYWKK